MDMETPYRRLDLSHRLSLLGPRGNTLSVIAAGNGPALMLLHGFPLDHRLWLKQLDHLSDTYHVIAPEFRGFGNSTLDEPNYTLSDLADDVEYIRTHLTNDRDSQTPDKQFVLCGLSMGGYVALEYWLRFRANLSGLILANTKPQADDEAGRSARLAMAEKARTDGTREALRGMPEKLLSANSISHRRELRSLVEDMMFSTESNTIAAAQTAMSGRRDFNSHLSSIDVPTLVITGEHDLLSPPDSTKQWASAIKDAKFKILSGSAHLSPLESPNEFNSVIREFCTEIT